MKNNVFLINYESSLSWNLKKRESLRYLKLRVVWFLIYFDLKNIKISPKFILSKSFFVSICILDFDVFLSLKVSSSRSL